MSIVTRFMKGKSVIYIAWNYKGTEKNFKGLHFNDRGSYVSLWTKLRQQYGNIFKSNKRREQTVGSIEYFLTRKTLTL